MNIRYHSFIILLIIVSALTAKGAAESVLEDPKSKETSLPQVTVFEKNKDVLKGKLMKPLSEKDGKVVDWRYYTNIFWMPSAYDANVIYQLWKINARAELDDGSLVDSWIEQSGMLAVSDMLTIYSFDDDCTVLSQSHSLSFPSDENPECRRVTKDRLELKYLYGAEYYKALRNFTQKDIKYTVGIRSGSSSTEYYMNFWRNYILNRGEDPDNFQAAILTFRPEIYFRILGISEDEYGYPFPFFRSKAIIEPKGFFYAEGGLGENCTLFVKTPDPPTPTVDLTITNTGAKEGYLDSWHLHFVVTSVYLGVSYVVENDTDYYLPVPTDPEKIEAAREGGYSI